MREPVGECHSLAMTACSRYRPRWHTSPRSQADVTVRPFPWLQTAQDRMKAHRTLSILVQATLCKTSTEQAQVGSLFHPVQPSLRMWAVPKTVKSASVKPRSCVSSAPQILAYPGPRSHVASGVPLTLSCGRSSSTRPSTETTYLRD